MEGLDKMELDGSSGGVNPESTPLQLPSQRVQKNPTKLPIQLPPNASVKNEELVVSEFKVTQTFDSNIPEPNVDAKKMRRGYSQRHRLKQHQYIRDLEAKVESLQAKILEISSSKIEESASMNTLLKATNATIEGKISVMFGELAFKEAQAVELKKERDRLAKLFEVHHKQPSEIAGGFSTSGGSNNDQ